MSEDGDLVLLLQTVVKIKIHIEIARFFEPKYTCD